MNRFFKFRSDANNAFLQVLILLMLCYFHAPAFAALNDGLVAYWSFDDCTAKENTL
jgi:hypothetical protein